MQIAARAPNHLGDGVMALPALAGLARLGRLTIHAPRWGPELYRRVPAEIRPVGPMEGELAVLFPPSLRAVWEARRCGRRVGTPTDHRGWWITDPVPWTPRTAALYRALAERAGATVEGAPEWPVALTDVPLEVPAGHVAIAPLSAGGEPREWPGFRALADALEHPVVFYGGPGEEERLAAVAGPHRMEAGLSLSTLAATLGRCAVLLTNDSGLAHFGRAVGVEVITLYGSTVPAWTGAPGARGLEGPDLPCRPCRGRGCYGGHLGCWAIEVETVLTAVDEVLDG